MRHADDGGDAEGDRFDGENLLEGHPGSGEAGRDGSDPGPPAEQAGTESGPASDGTTVPELDADVLFDVLANRRRRVALHYLRDQGGAVAFEDLVDAVARHTADAEPDSGDRRSVAGALYHVHLPKLQDAGLLAENDPEGEVRLSERVAGVPWSLLGSS